MAVRIFKGSVKLRFEAVLQTELSDCYFSNWCFEVVHDFESNQSPLNSFS